MFQADARQSSPAFCGSSPRLDITVFQSRYSVRQLSTQRQFSLVASELAASGKFSAVNKKYVVWLDAGSRYCGQGTLWQDTARSPGNDSELNRTTGNRLPPVHQ